MTSAEAAAEAKSYEAFNALLEIGPGRPSSGDQPEASPIWKAAFVGHDAWHAQRGDVCNLADMFEWVHARMILWNPDL
jgi:hypothetical protein